MTAHPKTVPAVALILILTAGCMDAGTAYRPLFVSAPATQAAVDGTMSSDFLHAASAQTLDEAARRWEAFLGRYHGEDVEYEDGSHVLHTQIAQMELARVYYLEGRVDDADRLLQELDPFGVL